MKTRIHAIAGAIGFLTILTFWFSTVISEVFGSQEAIALAKGAILKGMFVLIPAMAIAGASGVSLGAGRSDAFVLAKMNRMPTIAANGLLILLPMAFVLERKASAGDFDAQFYLLQAVELIAGAVNLTFMGLNIRDGIRLTGRGMKTGRVELTARKTIANGTMAFQMRKPTGFDHEPGQWVRLTLPNSTETGSKGASRVLSIASAPHEPCLTVATRIRDSAFKRGLKNLPIGAELRVFGPNGSFTLQEDSARPAVFIAGGIGITPFLSMIRHATHKRLPKKVTLFYSNREPASAAFLGELEELAMANPNFQLVATMTALGDGGTSWNGETGRIDREMLARHVAEPNTPIYYCVGSAPMVASTKDMLTSAGIPRQNMVFETFAGY